MHSRLCAAPTSAAARWLLAIAAALTLALTPLPARAQDTPPAAAAATNEKCLKCHDDAELKSEDGKPMAIMAHDFAGSAHRKVDCAECHDAALTIRHPKNELGPVNAQVCKDCHADEFDANAASSHGRHASGKKAIQDCSDCHGDMHTLPKGSDIASAMSPVNQIKTCGECHEDTMADYEDSVHARALLKLGLTQAAPSCSSCHGAHDIHPSKAAASKTNHARIPATCGSCHEGILRDWEQSAHHTALADGRKAPVCSSCHQSHAVKRPGSAVARVTLAGECGSCHERQGKTFLDSYHGKASSLKNTQAAVCADCHTPHANLPASDPRSSVHKDNLAETCGACHANVNASFLSFDPHADPTDPKGNPYLYWTWAGMTGLLLGVFGFFGLHGLLWLQRALVGKLRGEFKSLHAGDGRYVRRFSSMQMGVHVAIVSSFLLLAATGLPLKFAHAPWAPALMAVFGGAETAGYLHRLAGIVTFGYFIWHLGMLVHGLFVKNERGYFWGPRSMVPQPRDVLDFFRMVRYFLYLGPRPQFDRFTYWEKFDYLAVFWGVAIIGVSGLILWFPTTATLLLPGWALNAAYIVHSDEALLATGFIFLFHFFHTHLRPEAFPMDTVIFTGRMPLSTFMHERPLEYERLVAAGKLDEVLVPAPTPAQLRRAYVFGFTALSIGVVLAFFIFWGLLSGGGH
jgi:cytochrome b subunit of formate dehydrogenase